MLTSLLPLQGLIKVRGDKCWLDLTCMDFHYEVSTDLAVAEASVSLVSEVPPFLLFLGAESGAGHQVTYRASPYC